MNARPATVLALLALLALSSCGSADRLPPAAEPSKAPPVRAEPVGREVFIGHKPEGLVVDPVTGLVAVGLTNPDRLALVEARSGRIARVVPLVESPRHLQLAGPGGPVLVPAEMANALVEVDLPDGSRRKTPVGRFPHDAALVDGRVWVADERGSTVSIVEDGRVVKRLPAAAQPGGITEAGPGRAALVAVKDRVVELFDARRMRAVGRVPAGVGPTHLVGDGRDRLWIVDTQGGALLYVHLVPRLEVVRRVHLPGGPYGVAIDRERDRLWVTLTASNEVVELTANGRPRPLRRFPTVRQPNTVAVDERTGRVFVASRSDGTLQFFDPPPGP